MNTFRHKLYWLIPLFLILVALMILYCINLQRFTSSPQDHWSREYKLRTIDSYNTPQVIHEKDHTELYFVTDGKLIKQVLDSNYNIVSEETVDAEISTVKDFYIYDDQLVLFKDDSLIDGKTKEKLADATLFQRGINENIYYAKNQDIYTLNVMTKEKKKLLEVSHPVENIRPTDDLLLIYSSNLNIGTFSIYQLKDNNQYELILQDEINVGASNKLNQMELTEDGNVVHLAVTAESQLSTNKMYYFYYDSFDIHHPTIELTRIQPTDPVTNQPLENLSQIQLRTVDDSLEVLFRSVGFTFKDTNDNMAMNIYSMSLNDGKAQVRKLSDTYSLSQEPMFLTKDAVLWKESTQQQYNLMLASSNENIIEKTKKITGNELLIAFGITISNIATSAFVAFIISFWLIIPIVYLFVVHLIYRFKDRRRDLNSNNLVFYVGVLTYLVAVLLSRNLLFPENSYVTAPAYISFSGNSFVYILLFAIIALVSVQLIKREWGTIGKYMYFIGIQYLCYLIFLGPFYL
ncbi:hypothetical protein OEV98_14285 [Caldibacillus lycopersici]|uniref:Uncharacterized protein n=1 Tax=Perspicuibacillus lycopersici TaxID=1325689 RepID=A0AAE3IU87_9BACI|nr:hypothetical protein [Perspicuibacillus lycopersici]MCU9614708.1 hypothetical protein [Perspicuibacillus lycopersici]